MEMGSSLADKKGEFAGRNSGDISISKQNPRDIDILEKALVQFSSPVASIYKTVVTLPARLSLTSRNPITFCAVQSFRVSAFFCAILASSESL
jgi:hypothetical protein